MQLIKITPRGMERTSWTTCASQWHTAATAVFSGKDSTMVHMSIKKEKYDYSPQCVVSACRQASVAICRPICQQD